MLSIQKHQQIVDGFIFIINTLLIHCVFKISKQKILHTLYIHYVCLLT